MWVIKQQSKEGGEDMDAIQVFFHGDGLENAEIARVYLEPAMFAEEALEHLLVAVRNRIKARKAGAI